MYTTGARGAATVGIVVLLASGCGSDDATDEVTLRFAWWGSDTRHQLTEEVIELFEEEHPGITIDPSYGSMDEHFDRLATQTAGGDSPDVIQMDERYLREYAEREALLVLDSVDVSEFDDTVVENGRVDDQLYAVTMGINTHLLVANPDLFEEAGIELPDDESWTWDDFADISGQISENTAEGWGTAGPKGTGLFQTWLRQQGLSMSTQDGDLGFAASDAAEYFDYFLDLVENGAMPGASLLAEEQTLSLEQGLGGTGREAIGPWWSNESVGLAHAVGAELELFHYPTWTGDLTDSSPWLKSSMYLSASSSTDHPDEVQTFIDFFVNSEEAGMISMVERGIPPSASVRDVVVNNLEGMELATAEFIDDIEDHLGDPEPISPVGGSEFAAILDRYESEVYFGSLSPQDAAEDMVAEMEDSLE